MYNLFRKVRQIIDKANNLGVLVVFPLLLYFGIKLMVLENEPTKPWHIYVETFIFYFFLVYSVWLFLLYQCERLANFIDNKIRKLKFIGSILYIVIFVSLTFASYYFCIYHYDNNSFEFVKGSNLFEVYIDFLYYSLGIFLMNCNSSIVANSLIAKLFTVTEMATTFVAIVLLLANYKALRDPFNEHIENIDKED
jgi:hypothetical protein